MVKLIRKLVYFMERILIEIDYPECPFCSRGEWCGCNDEREARLSRLKDGK